MEQEENSGSLAVISDSVVVPAIGEEVLRAKAYAELSRSAATRRAYEADWQVFTIWCASRGLPPLPADARIVAVFLAAEADRGLAPLTVGRRLAAIAWAHHRSGHLPPQKSPGAGAIIEVMAGIRRAWTAAPDRKAAADADVVWQMLHHINGDDLRACRDRALIAIGMAAALRRSELVALQVGDIERVQAGIRLTIRRSKTDQESVGQVVAIPIAKRIKPVALLDAWMAAASITDGYVFRRFIGKKDKLSDLPMDAASVALVVKKRAAAAGLDEADYAGHSLRAGFLTAAAASGASIWKMQEVSRHKSVQVLSGYIRSAELFDDHAGSDFL